MLKLLSSGNGTTGRKGTEQPFSSHNTSLVIVAMGMRLLTMDNTPYDDSCDAVWLIRITGAKVIKF